MIIDQRARTLLRGDLFHWMADDRSGRRINNPLIAERFSDREKTNLTRIGGEIKRKRKRTFNSSCLSILMENFDRSLSSGRRLEAFEHCGSRLRAEGTEDDEFAYVSRNRLMVAYFRFRLEGTKEDYNHRANKWQQVMIPNSFRYNIESISTGIVIGCDHG